MKASLKKIIKNNFIYKKIDRSLLTRSFNKWTETDEIRYEFYRQFIKGDDTVFDIGANMGNRSKIFLKLGAKVVAVEPQQVCIDFLESVIINNTRFSLVKKALGSEKGEKEMLISDAHTISSLSPGWIEATKKSGRFAEFEWNKKELVNVTTLDALINDYGNPSFIKIDVEGYEYEVLSGLSVPVNCLSIEFTPEFAENTFKCIRHMNSISGYQYQFSAGENMKFEFPGWIATDEILEYLKSLDKKEFGDVYIKKIQK